MQLDFHFYATYALARAAGLKDDFARRIATASQFVDDAADEEVPAALRGASHAPIVTAHKMEDLRNTAAARRTEFEDQQLIWVPFHFLPGVHGSSTSEKLVCQMDGLLVKDVKQLAVSRAKAWNGPELLGVTAHVLGDTFSHHGFSGVCSRRNRVDGSTITALQVPNGVGKIMGDAADAIREAAARGGLYLPNWRTVFADAMNVLGALGHGAVDILPDQPYLVWSFEYEGYDERPRLRSGDRNNPLDSLMAGRFLYELFSAVRVAGGSEVEDARGQRPYAEIERAVSELVWLVGSKEDRGMAWRAAAERGALYNGNGPIPNYDEAAMRVSARRLALTANSYQMEPAARFFAAARTHQRHVLEVLLPRYGIQLQARS